MIINYLISVYLFLYRPLSTYWKIRCSKNIYDFYTNPVTSQCIYKTLKQNKHQQYNILCEILLQFECYNLYNIDKWLSLWVRVYSFKTLIHSHTSVFFWDAAVDPSMALWWWN